MSETAASLMKRRVSPSSEYGPLGAGLGGDELEILLTRVSQGDSAAFSAVYDQTASLLYGVICRILPRRETADDVLQDVFLNIWQKAATYDRSIAAPKTWLAAVARNRAIDHRRRSAERVSEGALELDELAADDGLSPDALTERSEDLKRLLTCLRRLPENKMEMVLLAYYQGLSRDELSARYGRPAATIKTILSRSLTTIKKCLDCEGHSERQSPPKAG